MRYVGLTHEYTTDLYKLGGNSDRTQRILERDRSGELGELALGETFFVVVTVSISKRARR
jgi:CobQ-like glutamine amidotransferase family enzyme